MNHEATIESLVALPAQGRRAASSGRSWLNLSPRRVGAVRRKHEAECLRAGFSPAQAAQAWSDVRDMVELERAAE
jgi:hypothetical protein